MSETRADRTLPLAALAATLSAGATFALRRSRNQRRRLRSALLQGPVTITDDARGVPTVVAGCRADAIVGLGYVVARDRGFQLDLNRRAALGRLSELTGADNLANDRLMRLLDMPRIAEETCAAASDAEREALEAFAAGVNLRWSTAGAPWECHVLRYRPEPWRPQDSVAVGRLIGWMLGASPYNDLIAELTRGALGAEWSAAIYAGDAAKSPPIVREPTLPAEAEPGVGGAVIVNGGGSNAWAVSGARSATGRPLLANDPHLTYMNPSIWHAAALDAPDMRVAGVSIPGVPAIGIGRTSTFAWGFTAAMTPQTALYRERLNPAGDAVADGDSWTPLRLRDEVIQVRDAAPVTLLVRETPRGPLFSDIEPSWCDGPVSLYWVGREPSHDIAGFLRINAARAVHDVLPARHELAAPPFNMAAADAAGNIATISVGTLLARAEPPGLLEPAAFPPRRVPPDELPLELNPARGWISSANGRIVGPEYPYPLHGNWEPPFRGERIAQQLDARARHSPADMLALQLDRHSLHAERLTPALLAALGDDVSAWALEDLRGWDFETPATSRATLLFQAFYHHWVGNVLRLRLSDQLAQRFMAHTGGEVQFAFYDRLLRGELDAWFAGVESREALARRSFREGMEWIAARLGPDHATWTWGAAHTLTFAHPFSTRPGPHQRRTSVGPFQLGGDRTTLNLTWWPMAQPFEVQGGPSMRFVADLREYGRNWLGAPLGQSGSPLSRHFNDQTADFLAGNPRPFPQRPRGRKVVLRPHDWDV